MLGTSARLITRALLPSFLAVTCLPAKAVTCTELSEFLLNLSVARTVKPQLTASRSKQLLLADSNFSGNEKRVLGKYIDRAFAKSDPAEGAFVPVDRGDCKN